MITILLKRNPNKYIFNFTNSWLSGRCWWFYDLPEDQDIMKLKVDSWIILLVFLFNNNNNNKGITSQRRRWQTICIKKRGRWLASIEDSVDASIQRLKDYIEKHDGGLITAIRIEIDSTMDNKMTINRKQK